MRALVGLAAATAVLALGATSAIAHPIQSDDDRIYIADQPPPPPPPPPPAPKKPIPNSLGFRVGVSSAGPASGFGFGLQGGLELSRKLRTIAEYEYVVVLGEDNDDPMLPAGTLKAAPGRGHRGRVGLRVNLGEVSLKDAIRLYADADATAGLSLVHGPVIDRALIPELALGLRLGYELMPKLESPSRSYDFHMLFRLVRTPDDTGFMFGAGMEWGSRPTT